VSDVTFILERARDGDLKSAEELLTLLYDELRKLAAAKMAHESPSQTLQPTALVHEAWLRLGGDRQPAWQNRAHFFGAAAEAMRRILIDRARKKKTLRHGSGFDRVDNIELDQLPIASNPDRLVAISEALDQLAQEEPQCAEVVKLHCFVGMTHPEIAEVLHVTDRTIKRYWSYAVAWLQRELETDVPFQS
jgi:RNA polymerase sigma factor (TIGR02999 family)